MSDRKEWIHEFFGGPQDFYGTVYKTMGVFGKKDPEKEVDGILQILKPEPNSHILDWCGGWGRHAIPLAKRGYKVTLLDFSQPYLERAQEYAQREAVEIDLVCADFRNTPANIQADYAVNLFTAGLGYMGESEDILALVALHHALRPNARILIDTMSLFWIVKNWQKSNWDVSSDGTKRYLSQRTFDFRTNTERAVNTFQDVEAKQEESREIHLHLYAPADLRRVLVSAGFIPEKLFGGLDGSEFTLDSKRVVMSALRSEDQLSKE